METHAGAVDAGRQPGSASDTGGWRVASDGFLAALDAAVDAVARRRGPGVVRVSLGDALGELCAAPERR